MVLCVEQLKNDIYKKFIVDMRMLKWMCRVTKKVRKNIFICEQLGITSIEDEMREKRLKWYEYMVRRPMVVIIRRSKMININDMRKNKGRLKITLIETINKELNSLNLTKQITFIYLNGGKKSM